LELTIATGCQQQHLIGRKIEDGDTGAQAQHEPAKTLHGSGSSLIDRLRPENGAVDLSEQAQAIMASLAILYLIRFHVLHHAASLVAL